MSKNISHIENQPEFSPEVSKVISDTRIAWTKTSDEIWTEMLSKINGEASNRKTKTVRLHTFRFAAAAVIAILTGVSSIMYFYTKKVITQQAQVVEIILPDNSAVKVFAQSYLSYKPLWWKFSRSVKLEGEGFFEVQKGQKFEVVSRKGTTVVLGTRFDVYARGDAYNVSCTSGKVKVMEYMHLNEVTITGGQKAILKPEGFFEVLGITDSPKRTQNQEKAIEEELNTVLVPEVENIVKSQEEKNPPKQTQEKEPASTGKTEKPAEQSSIKEQSRGQAAESAPEQAKAPVITPAVNSTPEQEKVQGEAAGGSPVKDKFRASLTTEQLGILENQQMSREEKRKAFLLSLSPEQKQLLKEQNEERARETNAGAATEGESLKDQQKSQVREQMRQSTGKENMEQQKQNRRNQEQTRTGQGNSPTTGNSPGGGNNNPKGN